MGGGVMEFERVELLEQQGELIVNFLQPRSAVLGPRLVGGHRFPILHAPI